MKTTDRQLEALAMLASGGRVFERFSARGPWGTFKAGGAGLRNRLIEAQLIKPRSHNLTRRGICELEQQFDRVKRIVSVDASGRSEQAVRDGIARRREELEDEAAQEAERRAEMRANSERRDAERRKAIPVRMRQLARETCSPELIHALRDAPEKSLVDLWDAIVNADAGL